MPTHIKRLVIIYALLTSAHAWAQSAGDFLLSIAGNQMFTSTAHQAFSQNLSIGGVPVNNYPLGNAGIKFNNTHTLGISGTYFITDHFAAEISSATTIGLSVEGKGAFHKVEVGDPRRVPFCGQVGSVRFQQAALLGQFYFSSTQEKIRPFFGFGVSHVWLTHAKLDRVPPPLASQSASISLRREWSPIFQAGLSYRFDQHWLGRLSVSYFPLELNTVAEKSLPDSSWRLESKTRAFIDPIMVSLHISYCF